MSYEVLGLKEKILQIISYILVAVAATVVTLAVTQEEEEYRKLEELQGLIDACFIEEADMNALEDAAAAAMVMATGDRWSYYIPASEYESYQEQMNNAYVGVGITIQVKPGDGFLIVEVAPGGPAEEAGLEVGDMMIAVEDQDIREMDTNQVRDLVRGKEGTFVNLAVLRQGERYAFSVERRQVQTAVATYELLEEKIGLVKIENFDSRCAQETIAGIEALLEDGAEKLIFDVRYNPGGFASQLVEILDYLLPEGELFRTVRYDGTENVDMSGPECLEIPMAVLVNGGSYSAAEFFAAALSEYEAAVIVGEPTVGKGYFQFTYQLQDGSAVALSVGKYFTPNGVSLAEEGITPDVLVSVDEETEAGIYYGTLDPRDDPQIRAAVEALNEK